MSSFLSSGRENLTPAAVKSRKRKKATKDGSQESDLTSPGMSDDGVDLLKKKKSKHKKREFQSSASEGMSDENIAVPQKKSKHNREEEQSSDRVSSSEGLGGEGMKKKLKKKKQELLSPKRKKLEDTSDGDSQSQPKKKSKHIKEEWSRQEEQSHEDQSQETTPASESEDWPLEDRNLLLSNIESLSQNYMSNKYDSGFKHVEWDKVGFKHYTAEQCKEKWSEISQGIRKYRMLSEILEDAKEYVKNPQAFSKKKKDKIVHPDMPKKPMTPYFKFYQAKQKKYHAKHPELSMPDLSKFLAKKFASLPESKKQEYKDEYEKEKVEYDVAFASFKKEHPDMFPAKEEKEKKEKVKKIVEKKPRPPHPPASAMMIYIKSKIKEASDNDENTKGMHDVYRKKFQALSDKKKIKWISKALEGQQTYEEELKAFQEAHPDYKAKETRTVLTKAEQKIKDRHDGVPEKPPVNVFQMFTMEVFQELKESNSDIKNSEKMAEVSRRWHNLSEADKNVLKKKCQTLQSEYKEKYQEYKDNLPEEEREKLDEKEKKTPAKKAPKALGTPARPTKPISAMFIYMNDHNEEMTKKHPELAPSEINRLLVKQYNALPESKKEKYKDLENECKKAQQTITKYLPNYTPSKAPVSLKHFPGEPKRPPATGYMLFCSEMLKTITDVPNTQRMSIVSEKWKSLSQEEKSKYEKKKLAVIKKYEKDVEQFKKTLDADALEQFELLLQSRPVAKKSSKPGKTKVVEKSDSTDKEESGSSSDESSDSSSGESDSSSDESSGSDSDSDSEETSPAKISPLKKTTQNGPLKANESESSSSSESESEDNNSSSDSDSD